MTDAPKDILLSYLNRNRNALLWKLEGVSEYDARRPLTASGTNLLGIVKHVASVELGYLGDTFGRPSGVVLPWFDDDAPDNADMWATPEESRESILELARAAAATSAGTVAALSLEDTGTVPWWPEDRRHPTLLRVLVHVIDDAARHAGHADIVRELIDGQIGEHANALNLPPAEGNFWADYRAQVQSAADTFKSADDSRRVGEGPAEACSAERITGLEP